MAKANSTDRAGIKPIDSSYQFQVGDLIEYTHPETGYIRTGIITASYCLCNVNAEDGTSTSRYGYAGFVDDCEKSPDDRPYFLDPAGLRLRPDLACARADSAFQALLTSVLTAPRRGRLPKSPYGSAPKSRTYAGKGASHE